MMRAALLLAVAAAAPAAELYRVAGVIVDSQTGSPIANASLSLSDSDQPRGGMVTVSGPDGSFSFDAPRGKFRLTSVIAGGRQVFGQMNLLSGMGTAVITGPDQDTAHLVFRWHRLAAIAGRVVDDQGEPVVNAHVVALCAGVIAGHARVTPASYAWTDDRGEYRIWSLPDAKYYLVVTAEPWWNAQPAHRLGPYAQAGFAVTYYPGTSDPARATPLAVQPGDEARADFVLTAVTAAKVTVACDNCDSAAELPPQPRGKLTLSVIAQGIGGTETNVKQETDYRWPTELTGLLPGHYLLRLFDARPAVPIMAERSIDVGAGDMTVSLSLRPPTAVGGSVTFKNSDARPAGSLVIRLEEESAKWYTTGAVKPDGSFRVSPVRPGKYRVSAYGGAYHIDTVRVGDVPLVGGVLNVEDGADVRLNVVVTNESGRLKGFAVRDGRPMENMLIVLAPAGGRAGYANQGFQTDSDGSFDWPTLSVGDYLLFAIDDPTIAFADADVIKPYLAQAKPIRIEPGKTYEENVPVQPMVK